MRGKAGGFTHANVLHGITPAYAGKRVLMVDNLGTIQDHPCVCGEKTEMQALCWPTMGSPLRMRGKVNRFDITSLAVRITPAYAGKSIVFSEKQ